MTTPTTITTCQVCRRPFERLGRYDHLCPECSPNAAVRLPSCPRCGEVLRVARTGQRVCRSCGEYYTQWNFPAVHSSENNTGPDGSAVAPKLIDTNRIKTASTYSASPGTNPTDNPQPRPCSCVSTDHPAQAGTSAPTKIGRGRASISVDRPGIHTTATGSVERRDASDAGPGLDVHKIAANRADCRE